MTITLQTAEGLKEILPEQLFDLKGKGGMTPKADPSILRHMPSVVNPPTDILRLATTGPKKPGDIRGGQKRFITESSGGGGGLGGFKTSNIPQVGKRRVLDVDPKFFALKQTGRPTKSMPPSQVIVNPSRADINRILKDASVMHRGLPIPPESGGRIEAVRYSINPDNNELHVWRGWEITHKMASDAFGIPAIGNQTGYIWQGEDGQPVVEKGFGEKTTLDELLGTARTIAETFDDPGGEPFYSSAVVGETFFDLPGEEPEAPGIEAFPFKFESTSIRDSNPGRVFDRFEKAGIDVDSEVDLTAAKGRIFREAGRPQPPIRFGFDFPPPQPGEPPITKLDINLDRVPLADNSVKGVQVDPGFLVNRFLKESLGGVQKEFTFSSKSELRDTVSNFIENANRITKPGTDVIVKMQDTKPGSGPERAKFMKNVDFIRKIQKGAGMILVGEQRVPSRGRGKQPVTWLAFRKPKE